MTPPNGAPESLRRQLFRSHLQVMVVAVGVIVVGAIAIGTIVYVVGWYAWDGGRGSRYDERGPGPLFGLIAVVGAAMGAASFVAARVSARIAAPLEDVRSAADRLASGDYDVDVSAPDAAMEIRELAAEVNRLGVALDETERRRLHLIGEVAHELRTPLSTIEGSMEGLMDGVIAPNDETFARIGRDAARLRRLADDLSALSATAEPRLDVRAVQLDVLTAEIVDRLRPQAEVKGLDLVVETEPAPGFLDPDRVAQVLTNVVGNAIQYTDNGFVRVRLTVDRDQRPEQAVLEVSDSGRGLEPDQLEPVFERFHRVDEHHNDGTGVGLAVARSWTSAHGGRISASSPGLGQGSTFRVELPLDAR